MDMQPVAQAAYKFLFVMDPAETLNAETETSLLLMSSSWMTNWLIVPSFKRTNVSSPSKSWNGDRLRIGSIRLIEPDGTERFPALPANGKIDLLEPNGIEVLPGRTLLVEVDMDADKSFLAVGAGNSGNWKFRPVVKAKFTDGNAGEFPDGLKLARIEGTASNIVASTTDGSGTFTLCATASPDSCVDVAAADPGTSIFGPDGAQALFGSLMDMDPVTVIGSYSVGDGILLNAVLLEIGGNAELVSSEVVSDPADGPFLLLKIDESTVTVHLQDGTLYFNQDGTLTADDVVLGADIDVEGVVDTDQMRAALVFVSAPQDEQIIGFTYTIDAQRHEILV